MKKHAALYKQTTPDLWQGFWDLSYVWRVFDGCLRLKYDWRIVGEMFGGMFDRVLYRFSHSVYPFVEGLYGMFIFLDVLI